MPKSDNQKLKIFYILDYLQRNSHEGSLVRASDLIAMLDRQHNISCDRKTVYSDVAALQEYGIDIVSIPGKNGGYYIASRNFELPELKLLIDAVESSKFITANKSKELVEKISSLASNHVATSLKRNVSCEGRIKPGNERIYLIIDAINEAINTNKQISFQYFQYNVRKEKKIKRSNK